MRRIRSRLARLEKRAASAPRAGCPECGPGAPMKFVVTPPRVIGAPAVDEPPPGPSACPACGREIPHTRFVVRPPRAIGAGEPS